MELLRPDKRDAAVQTLGEAFTDDPLIAIAAPDPAKRAKVSHAFMAGPVDYGMRYGRVWAHDDASPSLPGFDPNFIGDTAIGGTVYTAGTYPQLYQGNLFYGEYTDGWIRRLLFDASGNLTGNQLFATGVNGLVTIEQGPDGLLYYIDFPAGQVKRIKFNGPVAKITATPTSHPVSHGWTPSVARRFCAS